MKIKNLLLLLTLTGLLSLTSGCSVLIVSHSGGKKLDKVFAEQSTRKSVEKQLGPPEQFVNYAPPRPLSEIPEVRKNYSTNLTTGYGDYRYQGKIYDRDVHDGAVQAAGMVFALTLGAGEVLMVPAALWEAAQERKNEHFFRVWYSATGNCLGYLWRPAEKSDEFPK